MGVEPNAWSRALPVLCADLLRHWERDARFLCCQKIHIQFSTAEPGGSVYLPRGAFRNQVDGASGRPRSTAGIESLRGGGASPRPTENYPSKSGRPHGAVPTGLICLVLLGTFQRKGLRAAKGRPYREGKILWGGRVRTPAPTRMQGRSRSPPRGRSQTGPPGFAPGALARQSQAQKLNRTSGNFCTPRAQWPGGNSDPSLRFCAPKTLLNFSGGRPP